MLASAGVSGPLADQLQQAGDEAKSAAKEGYKLATAISHKAELTDKAGDQSIEAAASVLHQLVKRAEELAMLSKESADAAIKAAETSRQAADKAARTMSAELHPECRKQDISRRSGLAC